MTLFAALTLVGFMAHLPVWAAVLLTLVAIACWRS